MTFKQNFFYKQTWRIVQPVDHQFPTHTNGAESVEANFFLKETSTSETNSEQSKTLTWR